METVNLKLVNIFVNQSRLKRLLNRVNARFESFPFCPIFGFGRCLGAMPYFFEYEKSRRFCACSVLSYQIAKHAVC